MRNPCTKKCHDRSATCHGTCQKYIDYWQERKHHRERLESKRNVDIYVNDSNKKIHKFYNQKMKG